MKFSLRTMGWATIGSGAIGILAYGFLLYAVMGRSSGALTQLEYVQAFNMHDAVAMFQFLFLIPFAFAIHGLSQHKESALSRATLYTGVVSISLVSLTLLLGFPGVLSSGIYSLPQSVFGIWLIIINWRSSGLLPRALRWFGMIVGLGLILFGCFMIGYIIFVDPLPLRIPAASVEEMESIPFTEANIILHQFIWVGGIMGVLPLPFWTILAGWRLLRLSSVQKEHVLFNNSLG